MKPKSEMKSEVSVQQKGPPRTRGSFCHRSRLRPVLKWAGGKSALLPQMTCHFPKTFERYIEPFLGGAAVFLALSRQVPSLLADANPELISLYSVLRDEPLQLMKRLDEYAAAYSESHYYDVRGTVPTDPIDAAARTIYLNKSGFNGLYRQNAKGGFNVPFGKRKACPALYNRENLLAVGARLQGAELRVGDFGLTLSEAGAGDFVYCDPPYVPLSQTSAFNAYVGGGFGIEEQIRLKNECVKAAQRGAIIALSNSSTPFTRELFGDWDVETIRAKRAINSKGSARGEVEEILALLRAELL